MLRLITIAAEQGLTVTPELLRDCSTPALLESALLDNQGDWAMDAHIIREKIAAYKPSVRYRTERTKTRNILFTGATGFFGSAILGQLLSDDQDLRVNCLVRGDGRGRILNNLEKHGFTQDLNFACVDGDLSKPKIGVSEDDWSALFHSIDTIVHVAADTSMTKSLEENWDTNVVGSARLLEMLGEGCGKSFHYISTLSVFVDAEPLPTVCKEDDFLDQTERVYGGYAQSKWAAEVLVRESCDDTGLFIYRPGLITANEKTGYIPANDWFADFLSSHCFTFDQFDDWTCDYTPVNVAAEQTAKLICKGLPGTFHIANPIPMTYRQLRNKAGNRSESEKGLALSKDKSPFRIFKTSNTQLSVANTLKALRKE